MRSRWAWATAPAAHDVTSLTMPLRQVKDDGEIELLKKATAASIAAQREMMSDVKPGVTRSGPLPGK